VPQKRDAEERRREIPMELVKIRNCSDEELAHQEKTTPSNCSGCAFRSRWGRTTE